MRRAIGLGIATLLFVVEAAVAQCDVARGPVKAGTDSDVGSIDLAAPLPVTIASLHEIAAARPLPQSARISPVETSLYSVTATLVALEVEADSSYRLVLSDGAGRTMIAALPASDCAAGGALAARILAARAAIETRFGQGPSTTQSLLLSVEIEGVGFFDFLQGQPGAAPNGIELYPITSIDFAPLAPATPPARRRAVVGTNPRHACPLPSVTLQLSRGSVCPGESVTLSWQASDPAASVAIPGVGANLPFAGSTIIGSTTSLVYSARATNSCGSGPDATAVLNIQATASGSINASPSSIQQNGSATIAITVSNAASWSLSSSLGNPLSPLSGVSSAAMVAYTGSRAGTDTITLTVNGQSCGAVHRSTSITVNPSTPPPPPPPSGTLRCCDGTLSPTCTSCANKQGCCSKHGGVCGCP